MSSSDDLQTGTPKRRSRLWSVVFIISLGFNLFIGGLMIGHAVLGNSDFGIVRSSPYNVFWAGRAAGPEARALVRDIWETHREEIRVSVAALRNSQQNVVQNLSMEQLDNEALQAALAELRTRTMESQAIMHRDFIELLVSLTAEQRAEIAMAAAEMGRNRGRRSGERARRDREENSEDEASPEASP